MDSSLEQALLEPSEEVQTSRSSSKAFAQADKYEERFDYNIFPGDITKNKSRKMHVGESLDFETIFNHVSRINAARYLMQRKFYGYTGSTLVKYCITVATGISTGACAYGITKVSTWLTSTRLDWTQHMIDTSDKSELLTLLSAFGVLASSGLAVVIIPGLLVQYWTPQAAGAGVSLVMAYLNGNHIPYLLHWQVMITKVIGTISACSSSLPLGPEGPMVHIGAAMGSTFTYCGCLESCGGCICKRRRKKQQSRIKSSTGRSKPNKSNICEQIVLQNDSDHREIISAGAAAGLAAAFGAPIGGVMFAWEEASSFWSRKVTWRCFICTATAVLTLALMRKSASIGLLIFPSFDAKYDVHMLFLINLPFLTLTAMLAGVIGSFFNTLRHRLAAIRPPPEAHIYRLTELMVAVLVIIGVFFGFAIFLGDCIQPPPTWPDEFGLQLNCPEGQINDLYSLFFSIPELVIDRIFAAGADTCETSTESDVSYCSFSMKSLAIHCICYLLSMSFAAGLSIPGGLFMPCIMVGSSFGLLVGRMTKFMLPSWRIEPSMYALVGATAVLGGVFRASISLVVVVVEGTRQINYIFEVILAVVMSNWVAHHIHKEGVYESDLERNGTVSFLRPEPPKILQAMTASQIMCPGVNGVYEIESVDRVLFLLKYTTHNGFPVFSGSCQDRSSKRLEGMVLRSQIIVMLHRRAFCESTGRLLSTTEESEYAEMQETLEHEMQTFHQRQGLWNRHTWSTKEAVHELQMEGEIMHGINESLRFMSNNASQRGLSNQNGQHPGVQLYLNFAPYMNMAPISIRGESSAARAYTAFTSLGMRHLCVVDGKNEAIGMITRKDLDHAAGKGWWRHNRLSSKNALTPLHEDI